MGNQSNQGSDRQNEQPQANPLEKKDNLPQQEKPLGDDPASEGEDNESLPEGSARTRDLHSDRIQGSDPAPGEERQGKDRRGDGSQPPSNVTREQGPA